MAALGRLRLSGTALAGLFLRAAPTVAVTAPSGTLSTSPVTVSWTFSSPVGRAQVQYRIRFLSADGSTVVFDTANIVSAATTAAVSVALPAGIYVVEVTAADAFDWSAPATTSFTFDVADVSSFPDEPAVGSVYEVAINGVGYMLADHPEKDTRYERRVVPLDPQRLSTGNTPFSEAIDRYTMVRHIDWSSGAGQKVLNRDSSVESAYQSSNGINPFDPGQLKLLPDTQQLASVAYGGVQKLAVAGNQLFYVTGANTLAGLATPTGTPTAFTIAAGTTVLDLTSDGTNWYWTDGANIFRNSTAADPGAAWSASDARVMKWCSDRLLIARLDGAGSSTPNVVAAMNYGTGAEVPANTWTFEKETDVRSITSGDGYAWWAAARFDKSVIYAWQLGSSNAPFVALEIPAGQDVRSVGFYQGNVFVRCTETTTSTVKRAIIYRCAASSGRLVATRLMDITDATNDHSIGEFAGDDRFVYFPWLKMNGVSSGLVATDLSTGGWAKFHQAPAAATGVVRSVAQWYGRAVFTVDGYGVVIEKAAVGADDGSVASGQLTTSISDLGTALKKIYTKIEASYDSLPAGASITVEYSTNGGTSFLTAGTANTAGSKYSAWDINAESDSITLRLTLNHGTTITPVLRIVNVRAHPSGIADQVLVLTIDCMDNVDGLNGRPLKSNGPGTGAARARALESLVQSRVRLQDIDWADTKSAQIYDLIAVESRSTTVFKRHDGKDRPGLVSTVTLRRSIK